jgi:hypothetical protein
MMEDKIRQLCARAIAAGDDDLKDAISELQTALREHTQDLRKTLIEHLSRAGTIQTDCGNSRLESQPTSKNSTNF